MPRKRFEVKVHPKGEGWVVQSEGLTERKFADKMPAVQYAVQRATKISRTRGPFAGGHLQAERRTPPGAHLRH